MKLYEAPKKKKEDASNEIETEFLALADEIANDEAEAGGVVEMGG